MICRKWTPASARPLLRPSLLPVCSGCSWRQQVRKCVSSSCSAWSQGHRRISQERERKKALKPRIFLFPTHILLLPSCKTCKQRLSPCRAARKRRHYLPVSQAGLARVSPPRAHGKACESSDAHPVVEATLARLPPSCNPCLATVSPTDGQVMVRCQLLRRRLERKWYSSVFRRRKYRQPALLVHSLREKPLVKQTETAQLSLGIQCHGILLLTFSHRDTIPKSAGARVLLDVGHEEVDEGTRLSATGGRGG